MRKSQRESTIRNGDCVLLGFYTTFCQIVYTNIHRRRVHVIGNLLEDFHVLILSRLLYDNTEPLYFHRTHLISPLSWYTVAYRRIRSELVQSSGLSSASSILRPGDTDWPPKSWLGTQIVARPPNLAVLLTHCGHYNTLWSIDSQKN